MRHLTIFIAIFMLAGSALAARPDVRKMTCQQAKQTVRKHGAIVMTTGQYTYKRFVAGHGYCYYPEVAASSWVKTKDNPKCRIGYVCEQRMDDMGFGFGRF